MTESPTRASQVAHSRARISLWLEHDRLSPDKSPLSVAVRDTLPFLSAVWGHPATAMLLGAVAKSWCRSEANTPTASDESVPLNLVIDQVRQHPKTAVLTLGVVGVAAAYWLSRRQEPPTTTD